MTSAGRVMLCQKCDDSIRQQPAVKAAQHKWVGSTGSGTASKTPTLPTAPETAPAGTEAGYSGPAPMDISAGRRTMSDEERAKRFADGRCLYCGGFNHRAVECAVRNKAGTFTAVGVEVKETGESGGKRKGNKQVD